MGNILPEKLKNIENLEHFKKEIKTWKPDNCPYVGCVRFTLKAQDFSNFSKA